MAKSADKNPFQQIKILTIHKSTLLKDIHFNFIMVLQGSIRLRNEKGTIFMDTKDIYMIQPDEEATIISSGDNLILSIAMDNTFFLNGLSTHRGTYVCNSVQDASRDYTPLRHLLSRISNTYFGDLDILNLSLISQAYNLLYYLNTYHYESRSTLPVAIVDEKYTDRMSVLLDYIHYNYSLPITLQQVADHVNLTPPYLSKFFKQNMNTTFNNYVNNVRLMHAVQDLENTSHSITSITYDNGFASMNAFNKLFKETYGITPNKYRNQHKKDAENSLLINKEGIEEVEYKEHKELLQDMEENYNTENTSLIYPSQEFISIPDAQSGHEIKRLWHSMINLGNATKLENHFINYQIELAQKYISFEYGRVIQLFHSDFLSNTDNILQPSFRKLNYVIDTMASNNMRPYLDLSYSDEYMFCHEGRFFDVNLDEYLGLLEKFIIDSSIRQGVEFMESCLFELTYFESYLKNKFENPSSYVERLIKSAELIKQYFPEAKVGGINHDFAHPNNQFEEIIKLISERGYFPDFISFSSRNYEYIDNPEQTDRKYNYYYSNHPSYAKKHLRNAKKVMAKYMTKLPPCHISTLCPDRLRYHYTNDTCYQAAHIFKSTIDLIDEVDIIGYYQLSDLGNDAVDNTVFLDGSSGFFNRYSIKKPAFLALEAYSHARNFLISKGDSHILIKSKKQSRYMLGLCNFIPVNDYYSTNVHEKIDISDAYTIYSHDQTKKMHIEIKNVEIGTYQIIFHHINKRSGSLLDIWERHSYTNKVTKEDIDYFQNVVQSNRHSEFRECVDGTMEFHIQLAPHEVVVLAILLQK